MIDVSLVLRDIFGIMIKLDCGFVKFTFLSSFEIGRVIWSFVFKL